MFMDVKNEADPAEREARLLHAEVILPCEASRPVIDQAANTPVKLSAIPLSDDLRRKLEEPVDPRVLRILSEINAEQEEMAGLVESRRIIRFPFAGSVPGHAIRGADGHWTVVSGPPPALRRVAIV